MLPDRSGRARAALAERLAEARAFRGSEAYAAFVRLLAAVDACYDEELRSAEPGRTERVRGASAQCRALHDCLLDRDEMTTAKI